MSTPRRGKITLPPLEPVKNKAPAKKEQKEGVLDKFLPVSTIAGIVAEYDTDLSKIVSDSEDEEKIDSENAPRSINRADGLTTFFDKHIPVIEKEFIEALTEGNFSKVKRMLQGNKRLLTFSYKGMTPYQYAFCFEMSAMRKVIREQLQPEEARDQFRSFQEALKDKKSAICYEYDKYRELTASTLDAYMNYGRFQQLKRGSNEELEDYNSLVIGGLQRQWPPHLRAAFLHGNFSLEGSVDELTGVEAAAAVKEKLLDSPLFEIDTDQGGDLSLRSTTGSLLPRDLDKIALSDRRPILIQERKGNNCQYYIYGPQIPADLQKNVKWTKEKLKFDRKVFDPSKMDFPQEGTTGLLPYSSKYEPIYSLCKNTGVAIGKGLGFEYALDRQHEEVCRTKFILQHTAMETFFNLSKYLRDEKNAYEVDISGYGVKFKPK